MLEQVLVEKPRQPQSAFGKVDAGFASESTTK